MTENGTLPRRRRIPQPSVARENGATAAGSYSRRPPSPPFIYIPSNQKLFAGDPLGGLVPSQNHAEWLKLNPRDIEIITNNQVQIAVDRTSDWAYEQRREAQRILDFLYLGPSAVARNLEYLREAGITMILACQDPRMAGTRLNSVEKAAQALNIRSEYLVTGDAQHLIPLFPEAIRIINNHLLSVNSANGRGKVLIVCESGSERSAIIVAAYIMAMYSVSMINSLQFVSVQRFSCCFDEETKRKLLSWEDILRASAQVAAQGRALQPSDWSQESHKRQIDEFRGVDQNHDDMDMEMEMEMTDAARFEGRNDFVPFIDHHE